MKEEGKGKQDFLPHKPLYDPLIAEVREQCTSHFDISHHGLETLKYIGRNGESNATNMRQTHSVYSYDIKRANLWGCCTLLLHFTTGNVITNSKNAGVFGRSI